LKALGVVRTGLLLVTAGILAMPHPAGAVQERPTFRASVDRVAVAAIVRDQRGKPVTNLTAQDFELYDNGRPARIIDFRAAESPVSLALLADFSGSMDVAEKRAAVAEITRHVLSWLTPGKDLVGLFAFDRHLQELHPFAPAPGNIIEALDTLKPYGKTSLFDAIAETGRLVSAQGGSRRAVLALTDGADNASNLTPGEVSSIASSIDVPVYIGVVVSPLDIAQKETIIDEQLDAMLTGRLGDLARRTGGEIFAASSPARTSVAARRIVTELRHQYLIAFEPSTQPGWHPIDLRTRDKNLVVRARSGYVVRSGSGRP
jgi:Ca-activated chloride channel family protein